MLRRCLPLFYALGFVDYSVIVRLWKRRRSLRQTMADFEDTANFVADDGLLHTHLAQERMAGIKTFRRRLQSQGFKKVMAIVQDLHKGNFADVGSSAARLLKAVKTIKGIKGMGSGSPARRTGHLPSALRDRRALPRTFKRLC